MALIQKRINLTIDGDKAFLDQPIYLFQNDRNIDLTFTINNLKYDFIRNVQEEENVIETTGARYFRVKVLKPDEDDKEREYISDIYEIKNENEITFNINDTFVFDERDSEGKLPSEENDKIGIYKFQIQLYDNGMIGRITLPPVEFEVLKPIFYDGFANDSILEDVGKIDLSRIDECKIGVDYTESSIQGLSNEFDVLGTVNQEDVINESKLEDWEYGQVISSLRMNTIHANIEYLRSEIGNIEALGQTAGRITYINTDFPDIGSVGDALDYLLYKPLSISSFNINIDRNLEMGRTIDGCVLKWSYNKKIKEQYLSIDNETFSISTELCEYNYYTSFNSNKTFTLSAKDERNKVVSSTINIVYSNKIYWGTSSSTTYNNSFLLNELSNSIISNNIKRTIQVNATSNQYIYYVIPSRLGTPIFKVGGFEGGFSKVSTISFTNIYNFTENYDIYRSDNVNLGDTTIVIS